MAKNRDEEGNNGDTSSLSLQTELAESAARPLLQAGTISVVTMTRQPTSEATRPAIFSRSSRLLYSSAARLSPTSAAAAAAAAAAAWGRPWARWCAKIQRFRSLSSIEWRGRR